MQTWWNWIIIIKKTFLITPISLCELYGFILSCFYCYKISCRTKGRREEKILGGTEGISSSLSSSSLHEIKIIMGTLCNYDLISFMLMVAFISSSFPLRPYPDMIVNLHYNLFNRRRLWQYLGFHLICSFFSLLLLPQLYDQIYKHPFIFNEFTFFQGAAFPFVLAKLEAEKVFVGNYHWRRGRTAFGFDCFGVCDFNCNYRRKSYCQVIFWVHLFVSEIWGEGKLNSIVLMT